MSALGSAKLIQLKDETAHSTPFSPNAKFSISKILQTTLDVYDLVKRFSQALQTSVPYHSFHYHHIQTQHGFDMGERSEHQISYQLMLQGMPLGDIYLTRRTEFSQKEMIQVEKALTELVYPLRNALAYHEAIKNSYTCPLTLVGNRAAYDKAINREIDFAKRHHTPFSIILIDIDHFKSINDTYGHEAGDQALLSVAGFISQLNRNTDNLFRYGGEEFALILSHTPVEGAERVALRMKEQVEAFEFEHQGHLIKLTISAGVTAYVNEDTPQTMFKRADSALYMSKKSGRNRISIFR
ncbi:MAG: GGDEF domain-containing protein [Candidatus Berkiella sp.]